MIFNELRGLEAEWQKRRTLHSREPDVNTGHKGRFSDEDGNARISIGARGRQTIMPQSKAGYMCATDLSAKAFRPCNAGRTIYVNRP